MPDPLLEALERCRVRDKLSYGSLAKRLQVSDAYLLLLREGKRPIRYKLLRGIAQAYPELCMDIIAHLRNGHDA